MDYFDALHNDGWLADPSDRVHVVAVHERGCAGADLCCCGPRLDLRLTEVGSIRRASTTVVVGSEWLDEDSAQVG